MKLKYKLTPEQLGVIRENLSIDFIAGLIVGEGTFYWTREKSGSKRPGFCLKMHIRDYDLIVNVRESLGIKGEPIYEYNHNGRHYAMLIIRDVPDLKSILIPLLWPKLTGHKKTQFKNWFRQFNDPDVNPGFGFIYNCFKERFPELYR